MRTVDAARLGVLCLTLCAGCADGITTTGPAVSVGTAVRLIAQHCAHLGIDADEMAAELARDER